MSATQLEPARTETHMEPAESSTTDIFTTPSVAPGGKKTNDEEERKRRQDRINALLNKGKHKDPEEEDRFAMAWTTTITRDGMGTTNPNRTDIGRSRQIGIPPCDVEESALEHPFVQSSNESNHDFIQRIRRVINETGEPNPWAERPPNSGGPPWNPSNPGSHPGGNPGVPGDGGPPGNPGGPGTGIRPTRDIPPHQDGVASDPRVKISPPQDFDGTTGARAYLTKLKAWFSFYPNEMADDQRKIIVACNGTKGEARIWAVAIEEQRQKAITIGLPLGWPWFEREFEITFLTPYEKEHSRREIRTVRMYRDKLTVRNLVSLFRTKGEETGFNDEALCEFFKDALSREIKEYIEALRYEERPKTLEEWYRTAQAYEQTHAERSGKTGKEVTDLDSLVNEMKRTRKELETVKGRVAQVTEPVEAKKAWTAEMEKDYAEGKCFHCHQTGHQGKNCPSKPQRMNRLSRGFRRGSGARGRGQWKDSSTVKGRKAEMEDSGGELAENEQSFHEGTE